MIYQTLHITENSKICTIQFNRSEHKNALNRLMVTELKDALVKCREKSSIVVLEGSEEYFCTGADFKEINNLNDQGLLEENTPNDYYEILLWLMKMQCLVFLKCYLVYFLLVLCHF
jgi:polyketide biosynthesis enoyl-CoA hydratase PksH